MNVEEKRVVSIHYKLTDGGGKEIDSSSGGEPLAYLHGAEGLASLALIVALAAGNLTLWQRIDRMEAVAPPGEMRVIALAGTDAALFAELESAYQRQAPIVLWVYAPHWAPSKFAGEFVEFPPYSAECYNDPSVGPNPDLAYDCGKPRGPIWKVAWSGVAENWPGAVPVIEAFTISNDDMGAMVAEVDLNGKSVFRGNRCLLRD